MGSEPAMKESFAALLEESLGAEADIEQAEHRAIEADAVDHNPLIANPVCHRLSTLLARRCRFSPAGAA